MKLFLRYKHILDEFILRIIFKSCIEACKNECRQLISMFYIASTVHRKNSVSFFFNHHCNGVSHGVYIRQITNGGCCIALRQECQQIRHFLLEREGMPRKDCMHMKGCRQS